MKTKVDTFLLPGSLIRQRLFTCVCFCGNWGVSSSPRATPSVEIREHVTVCSVSVVYSQVRLFAFMSKLIEEPERFHGDFGTCFSHRRDSEPASACAGCWTVVLVNVL